MFRKTINSVPSSFTNAAGIAIGNEPPVPPAGDGIEKKMMDNAVTKRGGEDFSDDGFTGDESNAARGNVSAVDNSITEVDEVFEGVHLENMFVARGAFTFAGGEISFGEFG